MNKELKLCPFCSSRARMAYDDSPCYHGSHGLYYGQCQKCGATGPTRDSEEEAADAWNQRSNSEG